MLLTRALSPPGDLMRGRSEHGSNRQLQSSRAKESHDSARSRLVSMRRDIENQVRSLIKECGLLFPRAIRQQFRNHVSELLCEDHQLLSVIAPLLSIHYDIFHQQTKFDDQGPRVAQSDQP